MNNDMEKLTLLSDYRMSKVSPELKQWYDETMRQIVKESSKATGMNVNAINGIVLMNKDLNNREFLTKEALVSFLEGYKDFGKGIKKDRLIYVWGEVEGLKRWERYCYKQALTNTFEYKKEKYGMTEEEFKGYNKSRSVTLENLIRRHGVSKGTWMFDEYCEKQRHAGCSLEYFKEKYGEIEGELKYKEVNSQKRLTLKNFQRKYGSEEGIVKFEEYLSSIAEHHRKNLGSEAEDKFIGRIVSLIPECVEDDGIEEYYLYDDENYYFYDYVNLSLRFCVEYNGIYWHGKEGFLEDDQKIGNRGITAKERRRLDKKKMYLMEQSGLVDKCFVVWEDEEEKGLAEIKEFINERCKNKI